MDRLRWIVLLGVVQMSSVRWLGGMVLGDGFVRWVCEVVLGGGFV